MRRRQAFYPSQRRGSLRYSRPGGWTRSRRPPRTRGVGADDRTTGLLAAYILFQRKQHPRKLDLAAVGRFREHVLLTEKPPLPSLESALGSEKFREPWSRLMCSLSIVATLSPSAA